MKNIVMSEDAHLAEAEIEGIIFVRGVAQAVPDDVAAEIVKNSAFVEVPAPPEPQSAPVAPAAKIVSSPPSSDGTSDAH